MSGSGTATPVGGPPLRGRERDLDVIGSVLPAPDRPSRALLLVGEAGVGKSALLDVAADEAAGAGARVVRASGAEFEAEVSFAALNQVVLQLRDHHDRLDPAHQDALMAVLGVGDHSVPERLVVCAATLSLLESVAADRPLLLAVDDVAWLDRASGTVLGFVARRIGGTGLCLLAATRSDAQSFFERGGIDEHEVLPIDELAASRLIAERYPTMAERVRRRVVAEAAGNPLALLELPTALSEPQLTAQRSLPESLPLSRRLQDVFQARIESLPPQTRTVLLLAALDGTGDTRVVQSAVPDQMWGSHLAPAERGRLVWLDPETQRLAFRHPLIRSAVVGMSTSAERRVAHLALASMLQSEPERQALHLARATLQADSGVSAQLENASRLVLRRGDPVGAVSLLTKAADLTPDPVDRSRLLIEAAHVGADVAGDLGFAAQLLAQAGGGLPTPDQSLVAAMTAATLLLCADGDIDTGHRLLVAAINRRLDHSSIADPVMLDAVDNLRVVCQFGARDDLWGDFDLVVERLAAAARREVKLAAEVGDDPAHASSDAFDWLDGEVDSLANEPDPARVTRIVPYAFYVDRLPGCRSALRRTIRQGMDEGAAVPARVSLVLLAFERLWAGDWDEARSLADEGAEQAEAIGFRVLSWPAWYCQALLAAGTGDEETVRLITDRMVGSAAPRGAQMVAQFSAHARGLAAMGSADYESAYEWFCEVTRPGTLATRRPVALWIVMDLVESAVRSGHGVEAEAHVRAALDAGLDRVSTRLALQIGASSAIVADDDRALQLFADSLAIPGVEKWPFDVARVQLAYGERLRRARANRDARSHLRRALATFDRLGATPWATRAGNELRATGETSTRAQGSRLEALTGQEVEIAQLAASGLTNKQIGDRLHLSHRTVGAHLYRIFPKLGIASRAALRDALNE